MDADLFCRFVAGSIRSAGSRSGTVAILSFKKSIVPSFIAYAFLHISTFGNGDNACSELDSDAH